MRKSFLMVLIALVSIMIVLSAQAPQQPPAPAGQPGRGGAGRGGAPAYRKKKGLVFRMAKGFHHDSLPNAIGPVWRLRQDSGRWDTAMYNHPDVPHTPPDGKPRHASPP